ncbi:MAG TPA: DUF6789 family protein [Chloroflexota bacterium]|nr:DUF6789 family protein [Chloroflexota bacterium]
MESSVSGVPLERGRGVRRRWLSDAIIAGFVAIGTSTGALMVFFVLANGLADSQADFFRGWLWQLTHNQVVAFSSGRPAVALALHVLLGLVWAIVYARFVEFRLTGPGWRRGMLFALVPWIFSLLILLPAAVVNLLDWAFSAGPLVPVGNLVLHLIYGFTLGQLYDASADEPALAADTVYDEPLVRRAVEHSEDFGAAGILLGGIAGAAVGIALAVILPPTLPSVDFGGWSVALAVGGILAGGAVGAIVGSFAGLPQTPPAPADIQEGPDPFTHNVLPFLIPPFLLIVAIVIVSTFGTGLLQLGKSQLEIGPLTIGAAVVAAIIGTFAIGIGAYLLSSRTEEPPSSRETVSHRAEH